ncbi:endonuclease/exonuclease/phosphatase family protein [Phaeobacter porticola]|uniref:Endonuclease/Exonuclease/phosphatase family protein n=1 Tax=Phaeobacter porticola TaxID=1844006 RepID=A0A1L3I1J2_9RHOB|nr:endonuclease/exonuclease/phosphatase family protein [Phaeobacter porticola]APG45968.1 Endonuclease/Exonuclease/phosphatase family protein [Phaeobacter porticola]
MRSLPPLVLAFCLSLICCAEPLAAEPLRVASFNTELSRKGPGLLLRDLQRGEDPQVAAILYTLHVANADILVLQGIDWDFDGRAVSAFASQLAKTMAPYQHIYAPQPNTGVQTGLDMDGDGRFGSARDAQGYGDFTGRDGMAILSRYPILRAEARNLSDLLWRDLPGAILPTNSDGSPFPSAAAQSAQRLSSTGHWVVPIMLPDGTRLSILAFQATPPLFDGPEDRNGLRNRDEIRLWQVLLDGELGPAPTLPWIIAGGANLDPARGAGLRQAIIDLLTDPRLQDPKPRDFDGHLATVDWGNSRRMRVDYLLPSDGVSVQQSGVLWPESITEGNRPASRHALVWVDLEF